MNETLSLKIDRDICFSDTKGKHRPRQEKRSLKALAKLSPLLRRVLESDEQVLYVTQGSSPYSTLEYLTTGKFIRLVKFSILLVTDRRLLHLPAKSLFKPKGAVAEVRFADLARARRHGILGTLELEYRSGKKEKFKGVPLGQIDKLVSLLDERAGQGTPSPNAMRRALCPRCTTAQTPDVFTCPSCQFEFKSKSTAMLLSLLVPGGGYFYVGQKMLGFFDALFESVLILLVAVSASDAIGGDPDALSAAIAFGVVLAFEKAVTIYHANHAVKDFLPRRLKDLSAPAVSQTAMPAGGAFAAPLEP